VIRALAVIAVLVVCAPAQAGDLIVGVGSAFSLGSGTLSLGCDELEVAGSFDAGSGDLAVGDVRIRSSGILAGGTGSFSVAGHWDNVEGGTAILNDIDMVDGCVTIAAVLGDTTFADLSLVTTTGKTWVFESGTTQTITGSLTLLGAAGNLLVLRASSPGTEAFLDLQGTSTADYVDVADLHATPTPIQLGPNSVLGSNIVGFFVRPCGDIDGDLLVGEPDATLARDHLVGNPIGGDITYCNVIGPPDPGGLGADCEIDDIFLIRNFAAGGGATLQAVCTP